MFPHQVGFVSEGLYFSMWLTAVSFRVNTPARYDTWDRLKFERTKQNNRINNHNDRFTAGKQRCKRHQASITELLLVRWFVSRWWVREKMKLFAKPNHSKKTDNKQACVGGGEGAVKESVVSLE